ncbi:MAG: mycothiol conjugate amidase Mca [Acidimicrobiales bacterium]
MPRSDEQLVLLSVHAHPDDEASKGAGTVARYHAEGVRSVLVCCTGGEEGDILNPAMERPEVRDRLSAIRLEELDRSAEIIGYDRVIMLGYRDSGMPDTPANRRPDSFAQADLDEAVGRLVAVIRDERPQVVVTYGDDQEYYPHPDHLRVHDITVAAFDAAGDPDRYPNAGDPWQPLKLYYSMWSRARMVAMHEAFLAAGLESPYDEKWFDAPWADERITTRIPVGDFYDVRMRALLAHATQIDPESKFWFGLPDDVAAAVYPLEEYELARRLVDASPEDDLFSGVRRSAYHPHAS